jgi:hypothetical protein
MHSHSRIQAHSLLYSSTSTAVFKHSGRIQAQSQQYSTTADNPQANTQPWHPTKRTHYGTSQSTQHLHPAGLRRLGCHAARLRLRKHDGSSNRAALFSPWNQHPPKQITHKPTQANTQQWHTTTITLRSSTQPLALTTHSKRVTAKQSCLDTHSTYPSTWHSTLKACQPSRW